MAKITLNLNPKNDQLVPVEVLVGWSNMYLDTRAEEKSWMDVFKKNKQKTEKIGEINNVILNLKGKGGRAWFQKVFLQPFGGTATKEAKEIFDELAKNDAFKELEKETAEYNEEIRPKINAAAQAAQALTNVISNDTNGLSLLIGNFSRAFMAGPGKTTTAPAITKEILLDKIIDKIVIETTTPPTAEPTAAAVGYSESAKEYLKDKSRDKLVNLLNNINKQLTNPSTVNNAVTAIQASHPSFSSLTKEEIANILGITIAESFDFKRELYNSKKLLELGFVTENEHLAKLVEIRNILKEQAASSPEIESIKAAISSIIGVKGDGTDGALAVLLKTSSELQQGLNEYSKGIITERKLTFKEQQLAKLHIKKAIVKEYIETGKLPEKQNLNEFFFLGALLGAALAAVAAWAIGKLKTHYVGAVTGAAPRYALSEMPQNTTTQLIQSMNSGLNANGELVDVSGKKVADFKNQINEFQKALTTPVANIKAAYSDITNAFNALKSAAASPVDPSTQTAFDALKPFASSPRDEVNALNYVLQALSDII
jgi:hypothetical protein